MHTRRLVILAWLACLPAAGQSVTLRPAAAQTAAAQTAAAQTAVAQTAVAPPPVARPDAAPPTSAGSDRLDTRALAERALACTVGITCQVDGGGFQGSGAVITPAGHVLTATSVVPEGATDILVVLPGHAAAPARLVASDDPLGVAVLQVEADGLAHLPLAADLPAVGDVACTAGDVERTLATDGRAAFSRGIVSGLYDVAPQGDSTYDGLAIETTAAVNQGSDGGPLIDAAGRLCGVIMLGVSPRRWQGVAVPTEVLLRRFKPLADRTLPIATAPPPPRDRTAAALMRTAADVARHLVGIEVTRRDPPEILPRQSWREFRAAFAGDGASAGGWDALDAGGRSQAFATFVRQSFSMEVNQLLRRPPGQVTGLVISPDGLILTSLFNIGGDMTFVARAGAQGESEARPNPVTRIEVVLPDGRRHEATVKARHEPLGVALLSIEATDLDTFDLAATATSPQLGDAVAVVGWPDGGWSAGDQPDGGRSAFTLNTGIVAAAARSRGYQFQTDALLNYGNSGGPVIDAAGSFYGVAAAPLEPDTVRGRLFSRGELRRWNRAPNSGVGLVARADRLREALPGLAAGRSVERFPGPFLGVMADTSRALAGDVVVAGIAPGSPAAAAGLAKGDRILEFNGTELADWRDLTDRVSAATAGETVTLTVERRSRGPRLVIAGRDIETTADLDRLRKSLKPGDTFTGELTTDDVRQIDVVLEESR
jgi:S1-C subfamily serine protease